jgi:hypothetical protein
MSTHSELDQQLRDVQQRTRELSWGIAKQIPVSLFRFQFRRAARSIGVLSYIYCGKGKMAVSRAIRSRFGLRKLKHTCHEE